MTEARRSRHKFLLITSGTMAGLDGGSIMLRSLLERMDSRDVVWIACGASHAEVPTWMARFPRRVYTSRLFHRYVRAAAVRSPLRQSYFEQTLIKFPNRVKSSALEFARHHSITKIWVHAMGPAISLASWLAAELRVPMHASLQDDPRGHFSEYGDVVEPQFETLLRRTTSADVASNAMKRHYDSKYGLDLNARTVLFGNAKLSVASRPQVREQARRVAYAGNIWSLDAMSSFCDAVEDLSADPQEGQPFTVTVFSQQRPRWMRRYRTAKYGGLVPSDKMAAVLAQYDLLYCPMGFGERYRPLTELSFPAKIFTYLQAQVPIVAHGPDYATHSEFVASHRIGIVLQTLDRVQIGAKLKAYASDVEARDLHSRNQTQLITGAFKPATVASELLDFVDV